MSHDREAEADALSAVAEVIATRTLQAGAISAAALLLLRRTLPAERYRQVLRISRPMVSLGLSAYFALTFDPATRFPRDRFFRRLAGLDQRNAIALTFDDGPHPETTPRLLDALAGSRSEGQATPATFFIVAERAQKFPALVRRIFEEGHALGVHGLTHRTLALDSAARIQRDLLEAEHQIQDALGAPLSNHLFRPPFGFKSWTLARTTADLGWTTVGWSCDPRDYEGISAIRIVERLRGRVRAGEIILLHERPGSTATLEAVPEVARLAASLNLRCVALGDTSRA